LIWSRANTVTIGVQALVTDRQSRVLLVRHGYRPGWHFPGGGVERFETLSQSLARELEEEAGIVLDGAPSIFDIYAHFDAFPGDHIVLFVVRKWRQARVPSPNHEIAEHGFFALDALPEGTTAQTRQRIAEIFLGQERCRDW
jgi:8-oxo-dGTP pyrophosphatase MutT (NUDIX family)